MTPEQFANALRKLKIARNQAHSVLGISRSAMFNYLNGAQQVPIVVQRLIMLLQRRGIPREWKR
jgi:predicted transcriptional regulator